MDCDVDTVPKFTDVTSHSTLQLTFKKLPIGGRWVVDDGKRGKYMVMEGELTLGDEHRM